MTRDLWIFGYGSLVWRPAFPHADRRPGFIRGWTRRFWQASPDHRGTPEAPGRVVTLLPEPGAICWGVAYRVAERDRDEVLAALDHREKAGYERVRADVRFADGAGAAALVYVAGRDNPNFVGPAPPDAIAEVVRAAHGPSGSNREYVLRLADALAEIGGDDPHVAELARLVEAAAGAPR